MSARQPFYANDLKAMCPGLDPWFDAAARSESKFDNDKIEDTIVAQIRRFEQEALFRVLPVQLSAPQNQPAYDGVYVGTADVPLESEDGHTFFTEAAMQFMNLTLYQRPVQQVQRVRIMLNGRQLVFQPPPEWYAWDTYSGRFKLLPVTNAAALNTSSLAWANLSIHFRGKRYIPNCIFVDYIAGLPIGWETTFQWGHLLQGLKDYALKKVLEKIQDALSPGLDQVSASASGSGQSWSYSRFQRRRAEANADSDAFVREFKIQNTPIQMEVL